MWLCLSKSLGFHDNLVEGQIYQTAPEARLEIVLPKAFGAFHPSLFSISKACLFIRLIQVVLTFKAGTGFLAELKLQLQLQLVLISQCVQMSIVQLARGDASETRAVGLYG